MKPITISITPELVEYVAPLFDKRGFPTEVYNPVSGQRIVGLHTIERLQERFNEIIEQLKEIQSSDTTTNTPKGEEINGEVAATGSSPVDSPGTDVRGSETSARGKT